MSNFGKCCSGVLIDVSNDSVTLWSVGFELRLLFHPFDGKDRRLQKLKLLFVMYPFPLASHNSFTP
jgi:hypothetical protein